MTALTREDLDAMPCSVPDCPHDDHELYVHSRCHPDAPTWTAYADGDVRVECAVCGNIIVRVKVASG